MAIIEPIDFSKIRVQELPEFAKCAAIISVSMLRLDAMHPVISGNKFFKLKYNIAAAKAANKNCLLTFGGAFSNHLIATAAAAHFEGMKSIGMVRGAENEINKNAVLQQCEAFGMELVFISRADYALKKETGFLKAIEINHPNAFIIPEGGDNNLGVKGAAEIANYIPEHYTDVILSVGSGTTFLGLRNALPKQQRILGFVPMKGGIYLKEKIADHVPQQNNWELTDEYHFGGFGKINDDLKIFMNDFETDYQFALDRVYTAKMMLGLKRIIAQNKFPDGSKILCVHSGGLTGN